VGRPAVGLFRGNPVLEELMSNGPLNQSPPGNIYRRGNGDADRSVPTSRIARVGTRIGSREFNCRTSVFGFGDGGRSATSGKSDAKVQSRRTRGGRPGRPQVSACARREQGSRYISARWGESVKEFINYICTLELYFACTAEQRGQRNLGFEPRRLGPVCSQMSGFVSRWILPTAQAPSLRFVRWLRGHCQLLSGIGIIERSSRSEFQKKQA